MATSLPLVDLDIFLRDPLGAEGQAEALKCTQALIEFGCLILKDSRVSEEANEAFLSQLEDYFVQEPELLEADTRPEFHYQVGATLENTEKPKCHSDEHCQAIIASLAPQERPLDLEGGHADPKCRFFHRMGRMPPATDFPSLQMENVTPKAFESTWSAGMSAWGDQIKLSVEGVAHMLGEGLGVGDAILQAGAFGPHLLAPTATNLSKYGHLNEIFAGFHTDLNFLTIHGRSRYPGLHIWARNSGKRIDVKFPRGHLLVQAGKQLEHLTGGLILAGFHEVVCTERTLAVMKERVQDPVLRLRPSIRISSTFFWHISSDYCLDSRSFMNRVQDDSPLCALEIEEKLVKKVVGDLARDLDLYPEMKVGTLVQNELKHISLMA